MEFLVREPDPGAPSDQPPRLVIVLHGRGSNERDFFDLAPRLSQGHARVLSVRAPYRMGISAYRWFTSDYPAGQPPVHDAAEAERSRWLLVDLIEEQRRLLKTAAADTFVVGFSQGAIMGLGLALNHPQIYGGVAALSGRILPETIPPPPGPPALAGFPIFLSHGTEDPVLPLSFAEESQRTLARFPARLTYRQYRMAHEISEESLTDAIAWLSALGSERHTV